MKRAVVAVVLIVVAAAAAVLWSRRTPPQSPTPAAGSRPNVLLITIDTLRADRIRPDLTPAIERLARRGTRFTNVRATVPLTLPSHVSLMTGTIPPVHGVRENGAVFDRKTPTLARHFKDAGYRTGAFVGAYVLNRRFGLDEGFDTYDDAVAREAGKAERLEAERPGGEVVDAALKWITAGPTPFFLWIHLYDPHAPYAPPREFLNEARQPYDGEVAYVDAQVGRVLEALESRALTPSTIVAVTADHGESLGEHGEQTHGMLAYDATLRVPLVVAAPGSPPAQEAGAISLIELASLLRRAAGLVPGTTDRPGVYAETRYPRRAGWHALSVLADDRWKLIRSSETELYELLTDPAERTNVAAQHPNVVSGMAGALGRLRGSGAASAAIAPEAAERLRALGYVSGSSAITSDDPKAPNPAHAIAAWTMFEQALGRLQAGEGAAALPALRRLATEHPGAPVFQSTYAQALAATGDARAAVRAYRAAVAKWPADAALFHDLAVAARQAGDTGEAMRAEQAALALDATSAMALNGLGLLHADAGRSVEAASAFERAAQQDPGNASYWTNLGNARRALGDAAAAEGAYTRALAADAEFADALNGLGTLSVQAGAAAAAIPLFERALRRDPQLHEARLNLGIALQESGQHDKAAAVYRELLATAPASAKRERDAAAALLKGG